MQTLFISILEIFVLILTIRGLVTIHKKVMVYIEKKSPNWAQKRIIQYFIGGLLALIFLVTFAFAVAVMEKYTDFSFGLL